MAKVRQSRGPLSRCLCLFAMTAEFATAAAVVGVERNVTIPAEASGALRLELWE